MPRVSFQPSGCSIEVPAGSTLLDATIAVGLPIARACGADGLCARCGVRVVAGVVDAESPGEAHAKRRNRVDPELRLACRTHVVGDVELSAASW